jgi:RNase P/RNase MRP subunit p30
MFDIIKCDAGPERFGFARFFSINDCKGRIEEVENLEAAVALKNRKTLIMLRDYAFDEGAIRVIAEKKSACFIIDLGKLIRIRGVPRAIALSKLRNFLAMCVRFNAYYTFATFAEKESDIRSASEVESIIMLLGLNRGQASFSMKMLQHYLGGAPASPATPQE